MRPDDGVDNPEQPTSPDSGQPDETVGVFSRIVVVDGRETREDRGIGSEAFTADRAPGRPHPFDGVLSTPCAEWVWYEFSLITFSLLLWDPPKCVAPLSCGAERIDDLYFGRLSGGLQGVYGQYLGTIIDNTASGPSVIDVDVDLTNESLLGALGEQPDTLAMPVFNFCRHLNGDFEVADPTWGVRFGWDTNVTTEYPTTQVLVDLVDQVAAEIGLYRPAVAAAPPLESGHTFVKFPTWLWIDQPLTTVARAAQSDLGFIEVEVQATLRSIEFHLGDVDVTCGLDDMAEYVSEVTHPIDDLPDCHHLFEQVTTFDLATTLTYDVEQRIRQRRYATQQWPDVAWEPHPARPTIELTTNAGTYGVHELLSVNVNRELELADG